MIGMATVQLSAEAEGIQFPPMSQLKDSRTGLQGANDFIIIAGSSNDPMLSTSRYIGVPKNKNRRAGAPGNPMAEVMFDAQRARYEDSAT
jgi:replicative DNA helicase